MDAINLVPFRTITEYLGKRNWVQLLGNGFVFFPFPLLLHLNFPKLTIKSCYWTLWCVVLMVEHEQLLVNMISNTSVNAIDIDNFLLNITGCLLGLAFTKLIDSIVMQRKDAGYANENAKYRNGYPACW